MELGSGVDGQAMAIGEWEEYLSLLERKTPPLDALVFRLCIEKDAVKVETLLPCERRVVIWRTVSDEKPIIVKNISNFKNYY